MANLRNWIGLFLMGAINNLPYVVVNSAASTISDSFNQKNLVGVVFGANVALSVLVKGLNAFALEKVSYKLRFIVNGVVMLVGLFGVAYAFNFGFAIGCICILGSTAAFGENVTLGLLSWFPSHLVTAWSSGTGMAGLLGSSLFIIFGCSVGSSDARTASEKTDALANLDKYAFLLTTPVVLLYWFAYFVIIQRPPAQMEDVTPVEGPGPQGGISVNNDHDHFSVDQQGEITSGEQEKQDEDTNVQNREESTEDTPFLTPAIAVESTPARIYRCFRLVLWMGVNLCAVYVFEYVARGCAAKVRPKDEYHVGCPELYAAIQLCYQCGVFVSRSSVQLVRIRRVEVLSVLQFINMVLWLSDVHYKFLPVWSLPALMVYVGLLGGASYVNIFYTLLHDDEYPQKDRELCVNITGMFITLGIIIGTGLETAVFTTLLKND